MADHSFSVLIIDDCASDRKIYRRFLGGRGNTVANRGSFAITVHEADTAQSGLEACQQLQPDCVVLDYQLPDKDGLQVLSDIKHTHDMPVVFISGKPEALVISEAYNRGAAGYLSKDTVTSLSLQEAVAEALELEQH